MCGILSQDQYRQIAKQPELGWSIASEFVGKRGKPGMVVQHNSTVPGYMMGSNEPLVTITRTYAITSKDGQDYMGFGSDLDAANKYMERQGFKLVTPDRQPVIAELSTNNANAVTPDQHPAPVDLTTTEAEEDEVLVGLR